MGQTPDERLAGSKLLLSLLQYRKNNASIFTEFTFTKGIWKLFAKTGKALEDYMRPIYLTMI